MSRKKSGGRPIPTFETHGNIIGGVLNNVPVLPATQLSATDREVYEIIVQNDPGNAAGNNILVGSIVGQWIIVQPGQSFTMSIGNTSTVYVRSTTGPATVRWAALV